MRALEVAHDLGHAYSRALAETVAAPGGRIQHLVVTCDAPGSADETVVKVVDGTLVPGNHSVATVASTVFPSDIYPEPGVFYTPGMPADVVASLDAAAEDLYETYREMIPTLRTFPGNEHGTYFARMVSWPGTDGDGYNQLADRVRQIRHARRMGDGRMNAADFALEGAAETSVDPSGVQIYKASDLRLQGFPCLVHLDLSVLDGKISLLAVYRHWHMVRKAYGNLVGLSRLQAFLSQQTGYPVGELVVHGTVANAETAKFGVGGVRDLSTAVTAAVGTRP